MEAADGRVSDPVCGELIILAEDRAIAQTCEAAGGGERSPVCGELLIFTQNQQFATDRSVSGFCQREAELVRCGVFRRLPGHALPLAQVHVFAEMAQSDAVAVLFKPFDKEPLLDAISRAPALSTRD